MIRHLFIAAWRDLARNPIQSLIAIGGLAIGLAAAILAGIVARNQLSYDNFIPGHERMYFAVMDSFIAGRAKNSTDPVPHVFISGLAEESMDTGPHELAAMLRQDFSQVAAVTRLSDDSAVFGRVQAMVRESFYWADPNFFALMPVPILSGDPIAALSRPDGVVITLSAARKYFGRDNAVGQVLLMDHVHPLIVGAVIEDLPLNGSNLDHDIFASSLAPFSQMSQDAPHPGIMPGGGMNTDMLTLVQLKPGASLAALDKGASALMAQFVSSNQPFRRAMHFERLDQRHLSHWLNPDIGPRLLILLAAVVVILLLACVNFINLSTARSAQRGLEVAIRKVAGARRMTLIGQFLGESVLQALSALCVAVILVELSLPAVNAFLNSGAVFDYWRDPALLAAVIGGTMLVGVVAGAWPALVLSGFKPIMALNGVMKGSSGGWVRQGLVALQFVALIVLLIAAFIVLRQNRFATTVALRVDTDQMLLVNMKQCNEGMRARIAALPGVRAAICTGPTALSNHVMSLPAKPLRQNIRALTTEVATIFMVNVDFGFFELYGVKPLAGRLLRPGRGDQIPPHPDGSWMAHYVINAAAVRQLGFASAEAAVGQTLNMTSWGEAFHRPPAPGAPPQPQGLRGTIVGVVPDFSLTPIRGGQPIAATAYSAGSAVANAHAPTGLLHIKLAGDDLPETVAAIDRVWRETGNTDPIDRFFLNAFVQEQEIAVLRQGQAFAGFAGVALLLACLGLFGVALSTAARRTKEIGIRKAMGAGNEQVVALLLWQFARLVLWANVIAWPLAWWAMNHWLNGFAYHVAIPYWLFPAVGIATVLLALLTVAGQAFLVARQKPVLALRYE